MSAETGAYWSWRNLIRYILTEAEQERSLIDKPSAGVELKRLLMSCLINNQPHNQMEALDKTRSTAAPRHVRLAEEYMRSNMSNPMSISDLAAYANVSERSLFNGFREFRSATPMKYLTDLRLVQVRDDFQQATPTTTIAEVSARWGFTHQGAFSKAYKMKFGETPSETVRQHRMGC